MMSGTRLVNENIYMNKKSKTLKKNFEKRAFKDWYYNKFDSFDICKRIYSIK